MDAGMALFGTPGTGPARMINHEGHEAHEVFLFMPFMPFMVDGPAFGLQAQISAVATEKTGGRLSASVSHASPSFRDAKIFPVFVPK